MASFALRRMMQQVGGRCAVATACRGGGTRVSGLAPMAVVALPRQFSSAAASSKVSKTLQSEITHEQEQYEQSKEITAFLKNTDYKFVQTDGDVNMVLEKDVGEKKVKIEWQLSSPFDPNMDVEGEEGEGPEPDSTEVIVTVENKSGAGLMFHCSTQAGEDHRYVIGSVQSYASTDEKDSMSAYHGPDFEDLDDKLQEVFDEYLAELGMSSEICDFIDAMALDKEQREYVRWLTVTNKFMKA